VASTGNPYLGFMLFFTLSLGLGIPLATLAFFSGRLDRLPRSGEWMIWVRKLLGWVLVAMAAYFIKPLLHGHSAGIIVFALVILAAGVHLGFIDRTTGTFRGFELLKKALGNTDNDFNAQIQFQIAECYQYQGDNITAVNEYQNMERLFPQNSHWSSMAALRIAQIYESQDRWLDIEKPVPQRHRPTDHGTGLTEKRKNIDMLAANQSGNTLVWKDKNGVIGFGNVDYPESNNFSIYSQEGWLDVKGRLPQNQKALASVKNYEARNRINEIASAHSDRYMIWKGKDGAIGFSDIIYPEEEKLSYIFINGSWEERAH